MFDSLALLQSEVKQRLHLETKFLDPEDITAAAIETLSFYGVEAQQSQFGRTSKRVEFIPQSRDAAVNQAVDMVAPSYLERKIWNLPNEEWRYVPACHPSMLSEGAELRSAWWRDEGGFRLQLNYDPTGIYHRLWYYSDLDIAEALEDPLGLATRYGYLFTHETILNVIASVLNKSAQLPEPEQLNAAQLNALSVQASHSQAQVDKWRPKWERDNNAERAPRGRNRRRICGGMEF